jgi:hypothetical protein
MYRAGWTVLSCASRASPTRSARFISATDTAIPLTCGSYYPLLVSKSAAYDITPRTRNEMLGRRLSARLTTVAHDATRDRDDGRPRRSQAPATRLGRPRDRASVASNGARDRQELGGAVARAIRGTAHASVCSGDQVRLQSMCRKNTDHT